MKNLLSIVLFVGLVFLSLGTSTNAQSVLLTVKNVTMVDSKNLTFEVYAKNNSNVTWSYVSGAFQLGYNNKVLNAGTGTLTIAASDLAVALQSQTPTVSTAAGLGTLNFLAKTDPGSGYYSLAPNAEVRVLKANLATSAASGWLRISPDIAFAPGNPGTVIKYSVGAGTVTLTPPSDYTTNPTYTYANDGTNPILGTVTATTDGYAAQVSIKNVTQTSPNTLTYDIMFKNIGTVPYKYYSASYYASYNNAILNGGTPTITLIASASQLDASVQNISVTSYTTATPYQARLAAKAGPGYATGGYAIAVGAEVCVMRIQIATSVASSFAAVKPDLQFPLVGASGVSLTVVNPGNTAGIIMGVTNVLLATDLTNPVLPVELQNFAATSKTRDIELKWKTATEVNVNRFEVERSDANSTARSFRTVTKVNAAGNSNSPKDYSYTDSKLNAGKYSYRLKMVDNDGSFRYSKETESEVMAPKNFEMSQNYPNPFNPSTKIDYSLPVDATVTLELFNINGQKISTLVNAQQTAGYHVYSLSSSTSQGLSSGMYVYRLSAQGKEQGSKFLSVKKMILLK